jgi:hypothetical protein
LRRFTPIADRIWGHQDLTNSSNNNSSNNDTRIISFQRSKSVSEKVIMPYTQLLGASYLVLHFLPLERNWGLFSEGKLKNTPYAKINAQITSASYGTCSNSSQTRLLTPQFGRAAIHRYF